MLAEALAEREGFEPSIRFCRILTFQASAFDHSATAPLSLEGGHVGKRPPSGNLGGDLAGSPCQPLCGGDAPLRTTALRRGDRSHRPRGAAGIAGAVRP